MPRQNEKNVGQNGKNVGPGQGTGQCPTHFSQATSETRLFRRTLTCPLYRVPYFPLSRANYSVSVIVLRAVNKGSAYISIQVSQQRRIWLFMQE